MSKQFVSIPVEGPPTLVTMDTEELSFLQKSVGGWIEAVGLDDGHTLYLNEEGKLHRLPVNEVATRITRDVLPAADIVVGDCVLVGATDDEGESSSVDAPAVERLLGVTL